MTNVINIPPANPIKPSPMEVSRSASKLLLPNITKIILAINNEINPIIKASFTPLFLIMSPVRIPPKKPITPNIAITIPEIASGIPGVNDSEVQITLAVEVCESKKADITNKITGKRRIS